MIPFFFFFYEKVAISKKPIFSWNKQNYRLQKQIWTMLIIKKVKFIYYYESLKEKQICQ